MYQPIRKGYANELQAELDGFAFLDLDTGRGVWAWRDKEIETKTRFPTQMHQ